MTAPAKTHQPASVYLSSAGSECFELEMVLMSAGETDERVWL
jgi:hypothetical protein